MNVHEMSRACSLRIKVASSYWNGAHLVFGREHATCSTKVSKKIRLRPEYKCTLKSINECLPAVQL
jgi:hypothetical protein